MQWNLVALMLCIWSTEAWSRCNAQVNVGSTLLARKTITGWIEQGVAHDGFEGCTYDRILVFSDQTGLRCSGYHYEYAYNPEAEIWGSSGQFFICISGTMIPVQRI